MSVTPCRLICGITGIELAEILFIFSFHYLNEISDVAEMIHDNMIRSDVLIIRVV